MTILIEINHIGYYVKNIFWGRIHIFTILYSESVDSPPEKILRFYYKNTIMHEFRRNEMQTTETKRSFVKGVSK